MCVTESKRRGVFEGIVTANPVICPRHHRLTLRVPGFPASAPGQFVQLRCRGSEEQVAAREIMPSDADGHRPAAHVWPRATQPELTNREPMLRRPLSLAHRRDLPGGTEIDIIYRTAGAGTNWLATVKPGHRLSVLGPLGNGFTVRRDKPFAAIIGGGVGIPPVLYLADALTAAGRSSAAFFGVRTGAFLPLDVIDGQPPSPDGSPRPCVRQLTAACIDAAIATDDGTLGFHGLIDVAFTRWLERHDFDPTDVVVYACGPEPMERAIGAICIARGIECQLSLERHMACGMGTCQSCVVKVRADNEAGWAFKLCCSDGPVFDARQLLW